MWTTKEVIIISLATGLAFFFATIYSQRKIQQYIDNKVSERSSNPLHKLVQDNTQLASMGPTGPAKPIQPAKPTGPTEPTEPTGHMEHVEHVEQRYHVPPPGAGERWTPLPL